MASLPFIFIEIISKALAASSGVSEVEKHMSYIKLRPTYDIFYYNVQTYSIDYVH